jgi:adenylate cyclase
LVADIFVSYSRADKARVVPLVAAFEAQGWSVWWDPEITPGDEFDKLIGAELEAARAVVVVWTRSSVESRWVKGEARDAADREILVPVRFENARLPIDVRSIHTTEMDGWGESRDSVPFQALCAALESKLKRSEPKAATTPKDERSAVSICVLPFSNMSGDPEQEYFSDGITEDIITDLGKVSALSVVSRNTAFSFKGSSSDMSRIARQTKASYILFGSVRKAGARVRITAQLVATANDAQIWGERYDRDLDDIFALQDEISKAIVAALRLTLLPEEKKALEQRSTSSSEAYKLYLMARQFWLMDNERNNEIVVRICRRVVEIDPKYAQAWATLALAQWNMFWLSDSGDDGESAAQIALRLDPRLADAHAAMAAALRAKGLYEKGIEACREALRLEPRSYVANRIAGLNYMGLRRYEEAVKHFEIAAAAMESDFTAFSFVSQCYRALGDPARQQAAARATLSRIEKLVATDPGHSRAIGIGACMLSDLNEGERAKEWVIRARLVDPENINLHYNLACAMAALKEVDMALDTLAEIADSLSPGMVSWLESDNDFDLIREEPRFKSIVDQVKTRLATTRRPS